MAEAKLTYHDLIAGNKRASLVLLATMIVFLALLGALLGEARADWRAGLAVALLVAGILGLVGWFGGSGTILALSGAREIRKEDSPQLFNVVEELSIAAGVPMPRVYLIEDTAPNAFATGRDPSRASVAVTRGLLEKLDRDELQGVLAHELSHVRNYDIRFAMLMAVLVGSVVLLCDGFWRIGFRGTRRVRGGGGRGGGAQLILILLALILAILAPLFAKIIQLAMSRQREYLADASAVELTRYPEGLARALEKISADPEPLEAANRGTQHLYIVNPLKALKGGGESLFSTHPPIAARVARLRALSGGSPSGR